MNRPRNGHRYSELHVAMVCHAALTELTRVHELMNGPGDGAPSTGPLMHLHPDLRAAALNGVIQARRGLLHPADHHGEWVRFLTDLGWIRGPKNPDHKTHPNLIPWPALDPLEQDKNHLYLSVVTTLTIT